MGEQAEQKCWCAISEPKAEEPCTPPRHPQEGMPAWEEEKVSGGEPCGLAEVPLEPHTDGQTCKSLGWTEMLRDPELVTDTWLSLATTWRITSPI